MSETKTEQPSEAETTFDAARNGDLAELEKQLGSGFEIDTQDDSGNTLLMLAAYKKQPKAVKFLLEKGASVDLKNAKGQTPLGGAAFKGNLEIVKLLIEKGADLEIDQGKGMSAQMFAKMFGRTEVEEALVEAGAERRKVSPVSILVGKVLKILVPAMR